jgi:hypothetical protein
MAFIDSCGETSKILDDRPPPSRSCELSMSQELCKLKKELKKDLEMYINLVDDPRHVCMNCGRVANKKKNLCEPCPIAKARKVKAYGAVGD